MNEAGSAGSALTLAQQAVLAAYQQGGDLGALIGVPRVVVHPYNGQPPSPKYFQAIMAAQKEAKTVERDQQSSAPGRKNKYSKVEDWIRQMKPVLAGAGLLVSQVGGCSVDRHGAPFIRAQFRVIFAADGTGEVYSFDWPATNPSMTPGDGTATAYTRTFKPFLRGLLFVEQVDDDEIDSDLTRGNATSAAAREQNAKAAEAARARARAAQQQGRPQQGQVGRGDTLGVDFAQAPRGDQRRQPTAEQEHEWTGDPAEHAAELEDSREDEGDGPPDNVYDEPLVQHAERELDAQSVASAPRQQQQQQQRQAHGQQGQGQRQGQQQRPQQEDFDAERAKPNPNAPTRELPKDGGRDFGLKDLLAQGWHPDFARHLAGVGANEEVRQELRDEFLNAVNQYFDGDRTQAGPLWEGTGFTPQGPKGPKPTGCQLRRYCMKLDWTQKTADAVRE